MQTDDLVRTAYDSWAGSYDCIDNPMIAQAGVALAAHAARFPGARVLELGCGTGRNAAHALDAGAAHYTGVDGSPGMLAVARERYPQATWIEGDLIAGAARAGGGFDVALLCLVLEHVADVAPVLGAAARALRPGGALLIFELHPALHERGVGANFRVGDDEVRLPSFRHDAAELGAALAAAGFTAVTAVDHLPSPAALERSEKLARYVGQPVLLEVHARTPA
jgi:malonyl-CoA O-methyltransferase